MLDPRVADLLVDVGSLAGGLGDGQVIERPRHDLEVMALFDRSRSTLGAVRLLLLNNFVHEAVLLCRPLFTESLMLAELAGATSKRRAELVVGWMMSSLADLRGVLLEAKVRGEEVDEELAALETRSAAITRYADRHGVSTKAWRPNEKQLADKHGRGNEYGAFRLTHHFVHGSAMAVSQRYSKGAGDVAFIGGEAASLTIWADDTGLFASLSLLQACKAICEILEWPVPEQVSLLLKRVDVLRSDSRPQ
jgi:hypothetical protein